MRINVQGCLVYREVQLSKLRARKKIVHPKESDKESSLPLGRKQVIQLLVSLNLGYLISPCNDQEELAVRLNIRLSYFYVEKLEAGE